MKTRVLPEMQTGALASGLHLAPVVVGPEGMTPRPLTSLVGREDAVEIVVDMLSQDRLVTLTGTGGVGKTRIAMEVARHAEAKHRRVVWTDVAPMGSADMLWTSLAARLGLVEAGDRSVEAGLHAILRDRDCLFVFDNCEHMLDDTACVVVALLTSPRVSVLLTSREALAVAGERVWRVPSLSRDNAVGPTGELTGVSPSVELFLQRARDVNQDLVLDVDAMQTIDAICDRLDGIPLAIELAAARCRHMSLEMILSALEDRFRLLAGGARTPIARHRTMRLSMDWSYQHLDPAEQRAIRTLAVFRTAFSLVAACAAITEVHGPDASPAAEVVGRLVDKSMVVFDTDRYRLLDTVRAYALDQADTNELTAGREAHANWFATWLAESVERLPLAEADAAIASAEPDVLAALEWSQTTPLRAASIVRSLGGFWYRRARIGDITTLGMDTLAAVRDIDRTAWAKTACQLAMAGVVAECLSFLDQDLPAAIEVAESSGFDVSVAVAANALAYAYQSWTWAATGLAAARRVGNPALITWSAAQRCIIGLATADPASAADAVEALARATPLGVSTDTQLAGITPAYVDLVAGRITRSGRRFAELIVLGEGLDPTIELTAAIGACLTGLLGEDDELAGLGRDVVRSATDAGRLAPHILAVLEWVGKRDNSPPPRDGLPRPFVALWRPVGALALVEASSCDDALAVLAAPPQDASPGSFLEVADAAVRASMAHIVDADDVDRSWHEVLAGALRGEYQVPAVDALEALAARSADSPCVAGRLLGAADQLRLDTGYRHRFRFQQDWVDRAAATADPASRAEGRELDWRTVADWALRSWGERRRPSTGWNSLTPTEHRVVGFVTAGLTNPQIAEQLLMSKSTVKTHLTHVFTKLDVRTRAELAARAAQHGFG
jgi:predicted ATPase/DNA-binding CsgD family transcriptional regulator